MKDKTIGFRGDQLLIDLIAAVSGDMGKSKSDFIRFCIISIAKAYDVKRYTEYKAGKIEIIEVPDGDM